MQPEIPTRAPESPDKLSRKLLVSALNGTALYVLAYYLVWGLHDAAKLTASHYFQISGHWNPSRITYSMGDTEWWRTAVVGVYGIGPLLCLAVGLVAFLWFWRRERARRGQLKLFLLWLSFHSCNAVFGALLADTFTQSGFWFVPGWLLRMGNVVTIILALLAGLAQLALGYFGAVAFLQAHDSKTVMRYTNRQPMVLSTLVAPWVVGGVFVAITKLPYFAIQECMHLLMMGLLVTPMCLGCLNEVFSRTVRRPMPTRITWGLLAAAVVVALVWRLALSPPVAVG